MFIGRMLLHQVFLMSINYMNGQTVIIRIEMVIKGDKKVIKQDMILPLSCWKDDDRSE